MNNLPDRQGNRMVHEEQLLLERALDALKETTGIVGKTVAMQPRLAANIWPDAAIELIIDGQVHPYLVEIKRIDRFAAIGQIKQQIGNFGQPGLLVAPRITPETTDKCRELGVQFIDTHGNAFLQALGVFVLVKGQRLRANENLPVTAMEAPRGGTPTALKVIFALLCRPELVNAPYRDIKEAAGVALGAIGWVFFDLNARGYAAGGKVKGDRRILEKKRLLEEWVTNYPIKLRPRLNPRRFQAPDTGWWRNVDITQYDAQWGGEVAAEKLTGYLKPNTVTLYMRPENARQNLNRLVADNKLRAAPNGEIEILETFWGFPPDEKTADTVPAILVYADLLATMDPRNYETARLIYEDQINGFGAKG